MLPFLTPEPTPILLQKSTNLTPFLLLWDLTPSDAVTQELFLKPYIQTLISCKPTHILDLIFNFLSSTSTVWRKWRKLTFLENHDQMDILIHHRPFQQCSNSHSCYYDKKSLSLRYTRYIDLLRIIVIRQVFNHISCCCYSLQLLRLELVADI